MDNIIKWRSSYATGITSMDVQHTRLIDLINTMYGVIRQKESPEAIVTVLSEMSKYGDTHLRDEEALLQENDYPEFDTHIAFHQQYMKEMAKLTAEWEADKTIGAKNIYAFLRHWWIGHIVEEDLKYGPFLKGKGVN